MTTRNPPDAKGQIKRPWCSDRKPMTPERVLEIARTKGEFTVHRYLYRAAALRRACNRMKAAGQLRFCGARNEWLVFRLPADQEMPTP